MESISLNNPNQNDLIEGPTDEELKRIEDELDKYSD